MARSMSPSPQLFPPATAEQIQATEAAVGFALPALLKQLLMEVGNGGFGPGYGLIGVAGGYNDFGNGYLADLYTQSHTVQTESDFPLLPDLMMPVCNWGCGIYACLDCRVADAPVYFFNPDLHVLDDERMEAYLMDANGEIVWTYKPSIEAATPREPKQTRLFLHKKSFEEWIAAWAQGIKLWDEMERLLGSL